MKRLSILAGACFLTACADMSEVKRSEIKRSNDNESYRIVDEDGNFAGRIDSTYRIYDKNGNYVGRIKP